MKQTLHQIELHVVAISKFTVGTEMQVIYVYRHRLQCTIPTIKGFQSCPPPFPLKKIDQLIAAGCHMCPVDQGQVQEPQFHLIPQVFIV